MLGNLGFGELMVILAVRSPVYDESPSEPKRLL